MTTPPPPAPPPGGPPAGSWPPPPGAPPTAPSAAQQAPGAGADRGSRRGLVVGVGAALVVVAVAMLVVAAVVVLGGDDGPDPIAADEILDAIRDLERLVADERAAADDDGDSLFVGLDPCPLGDFDDVWAFAPEGLDLAAPDDPSTVVATTMFDGGADQPTVFQCFAGAGESSAVIVGLLVGRASDSSHRTYVRRTLTNGEVVFGEAFEHREGEIVPYCFEAGAEAPFSFCEADWVTDDVQIGVFLSINDEDAPLVEDLLIASLDHLVEQLLVTARDVEIVEE